MDCENKGRRAFFNVDDDWRSSSRLALSNFERRINTLVNVRTNVGYSKIKAKFQFPFGEGERRVEPCAAYRKGLRTRNATVDRKREFKFSKMARSPARSNTCVRDTTHERAGQRSGGGQRVFRWNDSTDQTSECYARLEPFILRPSTKD